MSIILWTSGGGGGGSKRECEELVVLLKSNYLLLLVLTWDMILQLKPFPWDITYSAIKCTFFMLFSGVVGELLTDAFGVFGIRRVVGYIAFLPHCNPCCGIEWNIIMFPLLLWQYTPPPEFLFGMPIWPSHVNCNNKTGPHLVRKVNTRIALRKPLLKCIFTTYSVCDALPLIHL